MYLKNINSVEDFLLTNFTFETEEDFESHKKEVKDFLNDKTTKRNKFYVFDKKFKKIPVIGKSTKLNFVKTDRYDLYVTVFSENNSDVIALERVSMFY